MPLAGFPAAQRCQLYLLLKPVGSRQVPVSFHEYSSDYAGLSHCAIAEPMWFQLAAAMAHERTLIPYPAAILAAVGRQATRPPLSGGAQVLPMNPAYAVSSLKHVVKTGRTPVLSAQETRVLLDHIDVNTIAGLRDRAIIGLMVYSFARVGAVVGMNVEDYFQEGKRQWFRLQEKGGKRHEVPAHHNAEAYVDAYLAGAQIADDRKGPLFRSLDRERHLTERRLHRLEVLATPHPPAMFAGAV